MRCATKNSERQGINIHCSVIDIIPGLSLGPSLNVEKSLGRFGFELGSSHGGKLILSVSKHEN